MWKTIRQLKWRNGAFALKTFAAAMLALYIAMQLNLSQPSWAVTTVYVVSQPFAGMVLAKSFYRILGTLIGAAMSLALVALFANTPELFSLALAAWIGLGTFVAIYLRDEPKAYVGMLSGYSAAIIGLGAVLAPDDAFAIAVERCLEIMLGISCGTLIHHLVLPQRAGDAMLKALDSALPAMARWANDTLRGESYTTEGLRDRRGIIATVVALNAQRVFAVLDTPSLRRIDPMIRRFQGELMSLLSRLMSVYDRFAILQQRRPGAADELKPLLVRAAAHIADSAQTRSIEAAQQESSAKNLLQAEINTRLPPPDSLGSNPEALLIRSILLGLNDVLSMWQTTVWTRSHIFRGVPLPSTEPPPAFHPYRDVALATIGGLVTMSAVVLSAAFWILSSWSNGDTAVIFAAIVCAVMGARDNAVAASTRYLLMGMIGAAVAALYLFVVLPPLSTFPALVIALAPFYIICGLLLSQPATASMPMPVIFVGGALIGLKNSMSYDFATYLNSTLGYAVGIGIAALALGLLRPLGADWAVHRQLTGMNNDLARIADNGTLPRSAFESRMFDRINALFLRLNPMIAEQRAIMLMALANLRIGLNIHGLQTLSSQLPPPARRAAQTALAALTRYFTAQRRGRCSQTELAVLKAMREQIFACGSSPELIRAGEALYRIDLTLRQHTPQQIAPAASAPADHPVTP